MVGPLEAIFPGLAASNYVVISPAMRDYNCIAWAASDVAKWWWPDPDSSNDAIFWPASIAREETIDAFTAMFATLGYTPCSTEDAEPGFEKVALFAIADIPTHAARQLATGRWTSKLGFLEDIEHELHALSGTEYGTIVLVMRRPIRG